LDKDGNLIESHKYDLLNILEFDSTRKRMSVLLREEKTGQIVLMCKGADSIVLDRMSEESKSGEDYK
jgi:phospholipid-translocating ATPase